MDEDLSLERHHRLSGGAYVADPGPYEVFGPDCKDLRPSRAKRLPADLVAKVLIPLCECNLARYLPEGSEPSVHGGPDRALTSLAWSGLHAAGFKVFACSVRGRKGEEELVVVLPEGAVSWPVKQLIPETADFLEVQAM